MEFIKDNEDPKKCHCKDEFHCVKCGKYCGGDGMFYEEDGTYCFECWIEKKEKEKNQQRR